MVSNNDVIFKEDWLFNLLKPNHPVVSPKCPKDQRQKGIKENTLGFEVGKHFSGWCFMIKRNVWEEIEGLDELLKNLNKLAKEIPDVAEEELADIALDLGRM